MTATTTRTELSPNQHSHSTRAAGTTKRLWKTGLVAGVAAAVATTAFAAAVDAADVSLKAGGKAIPAAGFGQLTLVAAIIGTILAVVLSHRARHPRHTFVITTIVLTALTLVPDVLADASGPTRIALALSHLLAAAIVIPALASRLSD